MRIHVLTLCIPTDAGIVIAGTATKRLPDQEDRNAKAAFTKVTEASGNIFVHWLLIPAIATAMTLWPMASSNLKIFQTDPGDTLLNAYFLEHAFKHLTSSNIFQPSLFWSPDFFWPLNNVQAWSDHLLGPSFLYAFFRIFTDSLSSYCAWLASTLFLNYISLRWACRSIAPTTDQTWLSIAALVTAFSPAVTHQIGHPQLLSLYLSGPIIVLCDQLINKPVRDFRIDHWLFLATILLCNGFFNIYVFVYGCFGTLAAIFIHIFRRIHSRSLSLESGKNLVASSLALISVASINGYIYYHYMGALNTFGARDPNEIIRNLPKPLSWLTDSGQLLVPGPFQIDTVTSAWGVHGAEQELFPGWGLLILLCLSVISCARLNHNEVRNHLRTWLVTIGLMLVMTICINDISLWPIVSKLLPGATSLRASSRVAAIIIFFSAAPISIAASNWRFNISRHSSWLLSTSILLTSFATIWRTSFHQFSLLKWTDYNSRIVKTLRSATCDLFWLKQGDMHPTVSNIHAMHAQFKTGVPTLNGYSGHRPLGQDWQLEEQSFGKYVEWFTKENQNGATPKAHSKSSKVCVLSLDKKTNEFRARIRDLEIKS